MPWTDSRSRDEWLAEVRRRGTRIRRRRRAAFGAIGALALVLPVSVTATVLNGGAERAVPLSVAGPAPAGGLAAPAGDAPVPAPPNELATGDVPAVATTPVEAPAPAAVEVHERVATVNGVPVPRATPTSMVPADDPVVRPPTTLAPPVTLNSPTARPAQSTAAGAPPTAAAALPACAAEALQIDVVPSKATFALGETARGTLFVQTYRATDCLVAMPASFRIENVVTGAVVGSVPATTEGPSPIRADGRMYTSTYAWDQRDCSGSACTQVPPGLYQAVAQWSDGSPYRGWGEFRIGG